MSRKNGVIFSYIFMFAEALSSILFTPYLVRALGQSEYGIYGLIGSVTAYLYLLDMGVGNAVVRYMSKYRFTKEREKEQSLITLTTLFYLIVALIIIGVGACINAFLPQIFKEGLSAYELKRAQSMLQITVINAAATFLFLPMKKVLLAYERFVVSKSIDIISVFLRVSLYFIALKAGGLGVAIVSVNLLVTLITGAVCTAYAILKLNIRFRFAKIEQSFVKEIFGYSFFVFLQMIATQINSMVDHILIGALIKSSTVILAIYTAANQIINYFQSFGTTVNGVLMPGVVRLVENKAGPGELQAEMTKVSRLLFMFLGIIYTGIVVLGKNFVTLWAGADYQNAYYVIIIIALPMLFTLSESIGSQVLWAINKHKIQAVLKILISVINVFLTVILMKIDPILGAAVGTAIAYLVGDLIIMNTVFKNSIGISIPQYYKGMLKGTLPALIISGIAAWCFSMLGLSGWIGFIINCAVLCGVYAACMFIFGLNDYEKKFFINIIKR